MKFLLWILLIYVVYRIVRGKKELPRREENPAEETHRDPVCGVYVAAADAVVGNLEGKRLYFCSRHCLERFRENLEIAGNKERETEEK
jgi:YHS domain-containing protein